MRKQATERWKLASTHATLDAMFAAEQVDAILICADNGSKAEIVEKAAARKIHVYSDKPIAATLAQAERIASAVRASGITYMCAYHAAYNPVYEQVRGLVAEGAIGKVYLARGVIGHGGPKEFGCSEYFCEWLFDKAKNGGGTFIDEACYILDAFVDIVGPISEVSAFTANMGHRPYLPPGVEDNSVAIVRFRDGALGVIDAKWGQVGPVPVRTSYHGTHGTIVIGPAGTEIYSTANARVPASWQTIDLSSRPAFGRVPEGLRGWRAPDVPRSQTGSNGPEQAHFVECVRKGVAVPGPAGLATARDVQQAIDAVYRAAETGQVVKIAAR